MPFAYQTAVSARARRDAKYYVKKLTSMEQWFTPIRVVLLMLPPWITPDGISIFRVTLAVPVIALLAWNRFHVTLVASVVIAAAVTLCVSVFLDAVDGWLARVRRQFSKNGASLDPFCDKLTVILVLTGIIVLGGPPRHVIYSASSVIALEILMQASRWLQAKRHATKDSSSQNEKAKAGWHGKLKMICECLGMLAFVLAPLAPSLWMVGTMVMIPALIFGGLSLVSKLR